MSWEIFTLGGGEFHRQVFNAVAAMMGHGSYSQLLALAMLCGLIGMLIRCAYKGSLFDWQWMIWAVLGFYATFVPVSSVIVRDELDPAQSSVVGGVPLGLAAAAGISNEVGHWLAQTTESVFSLPDDMTYTRHGMLFGNKLLDAAMRFEVTDARTAANLSEFWQQCVFYDLLLGLYGIQDLNGAADLWSFLKTHTSSARAFSYRQTDGSPRIDVCRDGANDELDRDLVAETSRVAAFHGFQLVRAPSASLAVSQFMAAMPVAYQYMTGLSQSATDIILQSTLANSMRRGIAEWAGRVDASAAIQNYALARAEAERRSTYAVLGALAQKYLPILLDLLQASIYAVFPLVFVLMLMPGGHRAAIAYLRALAWLTLWPVLYAILNLGMMLFSRTAAIPAITEPGGTALLTLANYSGFGQVMSDYSLFCGYLMLSIPILAYYLVQAGGAVLASATQGIISSYEKPASLAAGEATAGNVSLGNLSVETSRMFQHLSAPTEASGTFRYGGPEGRVETTTTFGSYVEIPQSNVPLKASLGSSITEAVRHTVGRELSDVSERSIGQSEQLQSVLSQVHALSTSLGSKVSRESRDGKRDVASLLHTVEERIGSLREFASRNEISDAQAAGLFGAIDAGLKFDKLPLLQAGLGALFRGSSESRLTQLASEARRDIDEQGAGKSLRSALEAVHEELTTSGTTKAREVSDAFRSDLQDLLSSQKAFSRALRSAERGLDAYEHAQSVSVSMDANANDILRRFAADRFFAGDRSAYDDLQQRAARGDNEAWGDVERIREAFVQDAAARFHRGEWTSPSSPSGPAAMSAAYEAATEQVRERAQSAVHDSGTIEAAGDARPAAHALRSRLQDEIAVGTEKLRAEEMKEAGEVTGDLTEAEDGSLARRAAGKAIDRLKK